MLTQGEKAPKLTGVTYDGRPFDIGAPSRRTVLWFFPKADTGG
jgi:peroxiredoxin